MGLLGYKDSWEISSNKETGDGYSDILVEIEEEQIGIVIEVKYPDHNDLDSGCLQALQQIESKRYEQQLSDNGMKKI